MLPLTLSSLQRNHSLWASWAVTSLSGGGKVWFAGRSLPQFPFSDAIHSLGLLSRRHRLQVRCDKGSTPLDGASELTHRLPVPRNAPTEDGLPTCPAFKEIGDKFGGFDLAMIPIGAYLPRAA